MKFFIYIGIAMLVCIAIAIGLTYVFSKSFEEANNIQRYEIVTDSNTVTIHTHMPIDSVELLLGKPQKYHIPSQALNTTPMSTCSIVKPPIKTSSLSSRTTCFSTWNSDEQPLFCKDSLFAKKPSFPP